MTAVMRAMSVATGPRVLRVGVVRGGRIVEERVIKQRTTVTVGAAETATFVVPSLAAHARPIFKLFERVGDDYYLVPVPGMTGRVARAEGLTSLENAGSEPLRLNDEARGKIVLGDTTLLFQFVAKPVPQPRPQLPLGVKAGLRNDWALTFIVAVSFLVHFGLVGTMYSDWTDPIVGDPYDVKGLVDMVARIPVPPLEVPVESAAVSAPTTPEKPVSPTNVLPAPQRTARTDARPAPHAPSEPSTFNAVSNERSASLAASADAMKMQILVGLQGGPAVARSIDRSNVPTVDLSAAAERNVGVVRGDGELKTGSGGPVAANNKKGLGSLATTTSDGTGVVAGHETTTAGPTGVATIGVSVTSTPIANADSVVAGLRARFRSCYQTGLLSDSTMTGKVVVSAKVGPNGEVSSADIASISGLSPAVGQCIAGVVKRATFSAPSGGGTSTLQIPVTFVHL
jgi:TonB family protein